VQKKALREAKNRIWRIKKGWEKDALVQLRIANATAEPESPIHATPDQRAGTALRKGRL
jgi:hypothetical protein